MTHPTPAWPTLCMVPTAHGGPGKMTKFLAILEKYWNFIILLKVLENGGEPGKMNCLGKNSFNLIVATFISAV